MTSKICARYLRTHKLCRAHCLHCLLLRLKMRDDTDASASSTAALAATLPRAPHPAMLQWSRRAGLASTARRAATTPAN